MSSETTASELPYTNLNGYAGATVDVPDSGVVPWGLSYSGGRRDVLFRALTLDHAEGFTQIVAEKESGTILGVHIVGPEAAELISEGALAVEMGASLEDVALTIHPHPTLPETMMEAAEAALGHAIHIYQGK